MNFDPPLIQGQFRRRYKRFFADVELEDGSLITAHCPNTGSMKNCLIEGGVCWISKSNNPKRKLGYTLEAVSCVHGGMAGVNTGLANRLVGEALRGGRIPELCGYNQVRAEVRYGEERSRLDFLLSRESMGAMEGMDGIAGADGGENAEAAARLPMPDCYLEVKNLTLGLPNKEGAFPDAVTSRGLKHLRELARAKAEGFRAILFFCVQHTAIDRVRPAWEIDPMYAQTLLEVTELGVEVLAYAVDMQLTGFSLSHPLPVFTNKP